MSNVRVEISCWQPGMLTGLSVLGQVPDSQVFYQEWVRGMEKLNQLKQELAL